MESAWLEARLLLQTGTFVSFSPYPLGKACHTGAGDSYTGEAINPSNLSWFEGLLGVGRTYRKEVQRRKSKEIITRTLSGQQTAGAPSSTNGQPGNGHVGQQASGQHEDA